MGNAKKRKTADESLLDAVRQGDFDAVRYYIEDKSANPDARDPRGRTALHIATERGFSTIVNTLLELGARVDATDHQKITPLMIAAERGFDTVLACLLQNGADIMLQNAKGQNAFHIGGEKPETKDRLKNAWLAALEKRPLDLDTATHDAVLVRKPIALKPAHKPAAPPQ
jgi:ankyrin repeat protein